MSSLAPQLSREFVRVMPFACHSRVLPARCLLALALVVFAAFPARALAGEADFDHSGLARQALEQHIRPLYAALMDSTRRLHEAVLAACVDRKAGAPVAVAGTFQDVVVAWSRTEHLRFGPAVALNRSDRVLFWPDRQQIGERQIARILAQRDASVLVPAELAKKSAAVQGLPALEMILFGDPVGSVFADDPGSRFACGFAGAIAANVAAIARDLATEWSASGQFSEIWLAPGDANAVYRDATGTTFELLRAFRVGINNARDGKLLAPLGLKRSGPRGGLLPRTLSPFQKSRLSIASLAGNIEGALHLFMHGGLFDRLARTEPAIAQATVNKLESVVSDLREIAPAGAAAFDDAALATRLAALRDPLAFVLGEAGLGLAVQAGMGGVAMGFTDDDGD